MSLTDYLDLKNDAKKRIDTLQFNFRTAYNKAEETTKDSEGYIDLDALKNSSDRDTFATTFNKDILHSVKKSLNVHHRTKFDVFQENLLMKGFMGFTGAQIYHLVDNFKENMNYEGMAKSLEESITNVMKEISTVPSTKLKNSDANDVVSYTNLTGIVNPAKIRVPDMMELIAEYEKNDIVTPKFVNEKPYKI
jgi:hypothetical protein